MGMEAHRKLALKRGVTSAFGILAVASPAVFAGGSSAAAPVGQGFSVTPSDLSHILRQIQIAEAHVQRNNQPGWLAGPDGILLDNPATAVNEAADNRGICDALVGTGPNQIASPLVSEGLRTVDGSCNNLIHGQEFFGAEGQVFPRLASPVFSPAEEQPANFFGPGPAGPQSSYSQKSGFVFDSQPRLISNLIVDQTSTNPAAVAAAGHPVRTQGNDGVFACDVNEVQRIVGMPSADFSLLFDGHTTHTLPPSATAAQIRSALLTLPNIGSGDIMVTGGPLPTAVTITFMGDLAATNVAQIQLVPGTSPVTGTSVATTTPGEPLVDEVQTLSGTPSAAFSIKFGADVTSTLPRAATATQVRDALEALPGIGAGNVLVTGGPLPGELTITFQGALAGTDVAEIEVVPGTSPITPMNLASTQTEGHNNTIDCVPAHQTLFIPNVTTDVGLSPPFNSLFSIFGQFFDHGVDKTAKGGSGTVFVPLRPDDPLIAGPDHILRDNPATTVNEAADNLPASQRFIPLTRATNQPGRDGILGTSDDVQDATNTDSPFVDQSQTYTSHPAHQVFLREYDLVAGRPVANGRLVSAADEAQANWAQVKTQARTKLGLELRDKDVLDVPMIAADLYGNFIPGPLRGLPQYVRADGTLVEGNIASPVAPPADVKHFQTAFLDDIAHSAVPDKWDHDNDPSTPKVDKTPDANLVAGGSLDPVAPGEYDDELLDKHFIGGDGRLNENIALTAVHQVFHSEHNRLVADIEATLAANPTLAAQYAATGPNTFTRGERLFQAARFVTEMEYQHLVFEEFGRKVQPLINPFAGFAFTATNINPAVKAEFAHAVYRFGHSMLNETIPRKNADGSPLPLQNDISLLDGFLNPGAFRDGGPAGLLTAKDAAGAIIMGLSDQTGNEIDEFVSDTLRNNLLGLPLDLAALNMTRARSEGVPPLNQFRKQIYASTNDSQLKPYTDWIDFGLHLKHPESLVNFVAAYGKHPSITSKSTIVDKREAARLLVDPRPTDVPPADAGDFMNSTGAWANVNGASVTGLDQVDLWMGGLAERTNLFGGLLGSTFNFVFESQMTDLQNSDRLYYLGRTPGMNLRAQLEGNSFAELVMRNTNAHSLKADAFATADCKFELANLTFTGANSVNDDPASDCDEHALLIRMADGTIRYRTNNTVDPAGINGQSVYNGTSGVDRIFGGVDNDTFRGNDGDDVIEGNDGADHALGGKGNDIITDNAGDDFLKGGPGNDAIEAGPGLDILLGGDGKDFTSGGANINDSFGGPGDDFMILGQGEDAGQGDSGDDWMQGGDQPDLIQGDSGALFFNDPNKPGNDVMIGQAGDDDYDAEGGDDIMVADSGIEKNAGAAGYDFSTGARDNLPQDADLAITFVAAGVPIQVIDVRDRFNEVEGLSGGPLNDSLKGDDVVPATVGGGGFIGCDALDQNSLDRIAGLDALVPPLVAPAATPVATIIANSQTHDCPLTGANAWGDGNILLGGAGSDVIEGRGANDIIDGDKYLDVRLSVRNDLGVEIGTTDLLEHRYRAGSDRTLQDDVMSGVVDPGNIVAVREILSNPNPTDVDTAVFSDVRANYDITVNADGSVTVAHTRGTGNDGTDTLWNVERLRFSNTTIPVPGAVGAPNAPATGTPTIAGTARVGLALTAANGTIADTDGIASVTFTWQQEGAPNAWTDVATGPSFTPGATQQGHRLRVVATVLDNLGGSTTLASNPTVAVAPPVVAPTNRPATGAPVIIDEAGVPLAGRPRVNDPIGVDASSIVDLDGTVSAILSFQWQHSADNGATWTDIPGATSGSFTPTVANLGELLQVRVSFTDDLGSLESLTSAPTRDVRPARGGAPAPVAPIVPVPPVPPVPPIAPLGPLALARVAVPTTFSGPLLGRGLPVSFGVAARTTVIRVRVFPGTSQTPAATMFIPVRPGAVNLRLRDRRVMRVLRRGGTFRLVMTPGTSRAKFGRPTTRIVSIHRGRAGR